LICRNGIPVKETLGCANYGRAVCGCFADHRLNAMVIGGFVTTHPFEYDAGDSNAFLSIIRRFDCGDEILYV